MSDAEPVPDDQDDHSQPDNPILQTVLTTIAEAFDDVDYHADPVSQAEFIRDNIETLLEENQRLHDKLDDATSHQEVIGTNDLQNNTPDERAIAVRNWLLTEARGNSNDRARMNKDVARGVLGKLAREQRYEAMRRAAGGDELAKTGSSDLEPAPGFDWQKFDGDRLSRVTVDLTAVEGCKNFTTGLGGEDSA